MKCIFGALFGYLSSSIWANVLEIVRWNCSSLCWLKTLECKTRIAWWNITVGSIFHQWCYNQPLCMEGATWDGMDCESRREFLTWTKPCAAKLFDLHWKQCWSRTVKTLHPIHQYHFSKIMQKSQSYQLLPKLGHYKEKNLKYLSISVTEATSTSRVTNWTTSRLPLDTNQNLQCVNLIPER